MSLLKLPAKRMKLSIANELIKINITLSECRFKKKTKYAVNSPSRKMTM